MSIMSQFGFVDIFVIIAYVIGFILIGYFASKRIQNAKDFTNAGQKLGWFTVAGSTIATCMGANMVIGKYDLIFESGLSGLTASLFWWVGWLFLLIMAKPLRASGATSIPSFLEKRYNPTVRKIASYCVLVTAISSCAAQFLTIGTILETLGICDRTLGTWIGAAIIILFTVFSGLWGVALTDTIQSLILLVSFGVVFPALVYNTAGGLDTVIASTPPERLDMFAGIAPISMIGWAVSYALSTGSDAFYAQRIFSARNTKDAVIGQIVAWGATLVVAGFLSAIPALAIGHIYPDIGAGSQFTIRFIAEHFPVVLKGLVMAALLGLMLTSGDTYLLLLASTITDDIVRPMKPDLSDRKAVLITRLSCVLSAGVLCAMALYVGKIYQLFKTGGGAYGAGVFFPLILGCFWKKANAKAMGAAMLVGTLFSFCFDMFLKIPLGLNIDGCIIGAVLCLVIAVGGSLWLNNKATTAK